MDMATRPVDEMHLLLSEVRAVRAEILAIHRETLAALSGIREMVDELHRIERTEAAIESGLDDVSGRLDQALSPQCSLDTCERCGSSVERHPAESGVLVICKACGHTAFCDNRTIPDRRVLSDRRRYGCDVQEGGSARIDDPAPWISDPPPE